MHKTFTISLLALFFLFTGGASAQNFQWQVTDCPEADMTRMFVDILGNSYVAGRLRNSTSVNFSGVTIPAIPPGVTNRSLLCKYTYDGDLCWVKWFDNSAFFAITGDYGNNLYVTGYMTGTVTMASTSLSPDGFTDALIAKFDTSGKAIWMQRAGGFKDDMGLSLVLAEANTRLMVLTSCAAAVTSYTVGYGSSETNLGYNIIPDTIYGPMGPTPHYYPNDILFKFDTSGNFQWSRLFKRTVESENSHIQLAKSISCDISGTTFVSGTFKDTMYSPTGAMIIAKGKSSEIYAARVNSNGVLQWIKTIRGPGTDVVTKIALNSTQNGIFMSGYNLDTLYVGNGYIPRGAFVASFDTALRPAWVKSVTGGQLIVVSDFYQYKNFLYLTGNVNANAMSPNVVFGKDTFDWLLSAPFIAKMDTMGFFVYTSFASNGGAFPNTGGGIGANAYGNVFASGLFTLGPFSWGPFYKYVTSQVGYLLKIDDMSVSCGKIAKNKFCAGDKIDIPYNTVGVYHPNNEFRAELSDTNGDFNGNTIVLGSVYSNVPGIINGTIPKNKFFSGSKYRIRVVSTMPAQSSLVPDDPRVYAIFSKDTANAGKDTTICQGDTVTLFSYGGTSIKWSEFPFTDSIMQRRVFAHPMSTTTYRVMISDTSGCAANDTDDVKITVTPLMIISQLDTVRFCKGRPLLLAPSVNLCKPANYGYSWYSEDSAKYTTLTKNLAFSPAKVSTYTFMVLDSITNIKAIKKVVIIPESSIDIAPIPDTTICRGNSVNFAARASACDTTALKYVWDNGLGTGRNKTVTPLTTTTYRLIAYDTINLAADTLFIKVTVRQPLKITLSADTTICVGESVKLRATAAGGLNTAYTIKWYVPAVVTGDTVRVSPKITTQYKAVLSDGCTVANDSAYVQVNVRTPISANVVKDTAICIDGVALLKAAPSGGVGTNYHYSWTSSSGDLNDTNAQLNVSPKLSAVYTVVVRDGCTVKPDTAKVRVTVAQPLYVQAIADTTICYGSELKLHAFVGGGRAAYRTSQWTTNNSAWTSNSVSINVIPTVSTIYIMTAKDACSPDFSDSVKVTVTPQILPRFTADKRSGCPPVDITFKNTTPNLAGMTPVWKVQGFADTTPAIDSFTLTFTEAGYHNVKLIMTNTLGCADSLLQLQYIKIEEPPVADFNILLSYHEVGEEVVFENSSRFANQYLWYFGDSTSENGTNLELMKHVYKDSGQYYVILVAGNKDGCTDTMVKSLVINEKHYCFIPNAFTPNPEDAYNSYFLPACTDVKGFSYTVWDRWGQQVFTTDKGEAWDGRINGVPAIAGVYLYKVVVALYTGEYRLYQGTVLLIR